MSMPPRGLTITITTEPAGDGLLDGIAEDVIYHLSSYWATTEDGTPAILAIDAHGDVLCQPRLHRKWRAPAP